MDTRMNGARAQRGFTLIEAMLGVAVLAFGLLAIANFQAGLLSKSAHNKARGEAIALAQQKLDEFRSYSSEAELIARLEGAATPTAGDRYPDDLTDGGYSDYPDANGNLYAGVNASFTRAWTVLTDGVTTVTVTVGWTDSRGNNEQVVLETDIGWGNIRGTADLGTQSEPIVRSPTGQAYLGDGTLSTAELTALENDSTYSNNRDGTVMGDYDGDSDLELIDAATREVVLTLPDTCFNGTCTDFVRIKGTVYLDRTDGDGVKASTIAGEDVFLLASDAAYCSRSYYDGTEVQVVTTGSTLPTTANGVDTDNDGVAEFPLAGGNGDYDYFNYTCYLGTGWYGNIGLLVSGAGDSDIACVGDPEASLSDGGDKWRRVEVAKRRVYRGMAHKYDENHEAIANPDGDVIFYSRGVEDAITLPDPAWAERYNGHNFVLSQTTGNTTPLEGCNTAMGDADALNSGMLGKAIGDFNCFNEDDNNSPPAEYPNHDFYPWVYMYLPDSELDTYDAGGSCPYDPSDPPASRYTLAGTIHVDAGSTAVWGSGGPDAVFDAIVETSDGYGNCSILDTSTSTAISYECDYYVWGTFDNQGNFVENPWTGYVTVTAADGMACTAGDPNTDDLSTATYALTATTEEITGEGDTEEYVVDGTSAASVDFHCPELSDHRISGVLSTNSGNDLDTSAGSGLLVQSLDTGEASPVDCTLTPTFGDETQVSYECLVEEQSYTGGWNGEVLVTWPDTYTNCTFDNPTAFSTVIAPDGWAFTGLTATVTGYDSYCDGPRTEATIFGTILADNLYDISITAIGNTADDNGGACTIDNVDFDGITATYAFSCGVSSDNANGFGGSVDVTAIDTLNGTEAVCTPASQDVSNVKFDRTITEVSCEAAPVP